MLRSFGMRALSLALVAACLGQGCVAAVLFFIRYVEPLNWPSQEGEVVSIASERVDGLSEFETRIGFRYSIHGYERIAYYYEFGPEFDARKLRNAFAIGSKQRVRYNPENFSEIEAPFVLTMGRVAFLIPTIISVVCGIAARWFWVEGRQQDSA